MPDLRQRFIDLAVRPLAGKEAAEHLARGEMMDRLAHSDPGPSDDPLETATSALQGAKAGRARYFGVLSLVAVVFLTGVLGMVFKKGWEELTRLDGFYGLIHHHHSHREIREQYLAEGLDEGQRLFLFANTRGAAAREQMKWLDESWKRFPDDPAWFEELIAVSGSAQSRLSESVLQQAARIDADNGLWLLMDASGRNQNRRASGRERRGTPAHQTALEQEDREIVALLEEAVRKPEILTRIPQRTADRLRLLGPPADLAELADRRTHAELQCSTYPSPHLTREFWIRHADTLVRANDQAGLRELIRIWHLVVLDWIEKGQLSGHANSHIGRLRDHVHILERCAATLRLPAEEQRLKTLSTALAGLGSPTASGIEDRAAASAWGAWRSTHGDVVTEAELEPGRRAEHAVADRFFATIVAGLFGVLAAFALFEGWRRKTSLRGLAAGLFPLLRPVDFTWLAVLGIAVPIAGHVGVTRFTPLGNRDFGLLRWDMTPAMAQAGGSFLFATCLLVQTARWRIAKRGGVLGLRPSLWQGWLVAGVTAVFVPAIGGVRYVPEPHQEDFLLIAGTVAGIPLLWLLWRASALLFCPTSAALGGVLACRMLVPGFVAAAVSLLALTPALKHEERQWTARDQVGLPDPSGSGLNVLDARMMERMREHLRTAMK